MADPSLSSVVSVSAIPRFLYDVYENLYEDGQLMMFAHLPPPWTSSFFKQAETAEQPVKLFIGKHNGNGYVYPNGTVVRLTAANEVEHIRQQDACYSDSNGVLAPFGWYEDIWQGRENSWIHVL